MKSLAVLVSVLLLVACSDSGGGDDPTSTPPDAGTSASPSGGADADGESGDPDASAEPGADVAPPVGDSPLAVSPDLFTRDGYGTVDVVRMDVRTVTTPGICVDGDESGCTLADVIADTDPDASFSVDIPVHFTAPDFPEDGRETNAEMRQRGASARLDPQKSFRIELKGQGVRWRGEDRIQANKHPYDASHIRNKLSFDLMRDIPNLVSSRTQFVNLWIDDGQGPVDYGLFTHDESSDKEYLINRGWDTDGNLYKTEQFVFSAGDLAQMRLDAEGEPLDEDAFESRLEIEHGDDHRPLLRMMEAMTDQDRDFEDVLATHFDDDNVLTWVTVNFLLHQVDAITHNFYLYNPAGTERFYFLPWDYDDTFAVEQPPADGFDEAELSRRLSYGYAKGAASNFVKRYYQRPGIHARVLAKAEELRGGPLSDATIADMAARYTAVIAPFATRPPDDLTYDAADSARFAGFVSASHDALRTNYAIPMPPSLDVVAVEPTAIAVRWSPATDVTGGTVTYDVEISSSPGFEPENRLFLETGIADAVDRVGIDVPRDRVSPGTRYVRLVARSSNDPARFWQIASNRETIGGTTRTGVREFVVP